MVAAQHLDYAVELIEDTEGLYYVQIPELPGCSATGSNPSEALDKLAKAKKAWIRNARKQGRAVPEPEREKTYSGRFVLRMDRRLHEDLSRRARREGISLNQYVNKLIVAGQRAADYEVIREDLRELKELCGGAAGQEPETVKKVQAGGE